MSDSRRSGRHARYRAVVADGDAARRALLTAALESVGFHATAVHDGQELLDLLEMTPPRHFRLVVAAQHMPRLFGTEVLARSSNRRARWVIVATDATPELEATAESYGAHAVVRLPLDVEQLLAAIDRIMMGDTEPGIRSA